jgi:hypothetical protein
LGTLFVVWEGGNQFLLFYSRREMRRRERERERASWREMRRKFEACCASSHGFCHLEKAVMEGGAT